jgi:hypothetical protein
VTTAISCAAFPRATIYNLIVAEMVHVRMKSSPEQQVFTCDRIECADGWLTLINSDDEVIAGFQLKCVAQWQVEPKQIQTLDFSALTLEELETYRDLHAKIVRVETEPMPKRKPPKKHPFSRTDFLKLVKKAATPKKKA